MTINTIDIPLDLKEAIATERCAVLVGAGASQASGFPSWEKLLSDLTEKIHELKEVVINEIDLVNDNL